MRTESVAIVALLTMGLGCGQPEAPPDPPEVVNRFRSASPPPEVSDIANQEFAYPLSLDDATEILMRTIVFAPNAIGIAGNPSRQVHAFNVVLDQPNATELLDRLFEQAKTAGRLYAICGFQVVDPNKATVLAKRLAECRAVVVTARGCLLEKRSVSDVLHTIVRDRYGRSFRRDRDRTYKYFAMLANLALQRPVRAVAPRAVARAAPTHPAAERRR